MIPAAAPPPALMRRSAAASLLVSLALASAPARAEVYYYRDGLGRIQISDAPVHEGFKKITPEEKSQIDVVEAPRPPARSGPGPGVRTAPREVPEEDAPAAAPDLYDVDDSRFARIIHEAAAAAGLDPGLVRAVVKVESDFNPRCLSRAGAMGLMQLMPGTAREVGCADPWDPRQNVFGGSAYLRKMLDRFGGDLDLALAAYNAGPGRVEKAGRAIPDIRETRNYVRKVNHYYGRFRAAPSGAATQAQDLRRQAVAAYRRGKVQRAAELFRAVCREDPGDATAHYNLGFLYSKEGYYQKAIRMYRAAIALDPYMSAAYYNLAVTLERRGDLAEAARVWRDYIDHESDPVKSATAERYIAQIERYREGDGR